MKILTNIFGAIWATWMLILFIVTMMIFLIPFMLFCYFAPDLVRTKRFVSYSRIWMGIYLPLAGFPLRVKGKKYFEKGRNYIVVCNHNSFLDILAATPGIPGANKTIAKVELAKVPVFGMMYRSGSVLVDRKSDQSRRESIGKMKEALQNGLHMCIYPEGTRNKTDLPLKPFHSGAFRLSIDTGKPIIPSLIFNTRKGMPANKIFFAMPQILEMHFLPAIDVQPGDTAASLQQRVYDVMYSYYQKNAR